MKNYPKYICPTCNTEFTVTDHPERPRKYCSKKCSKVGINNPNWQGKCAALGSNHPKWKGDNVGIDALHTYIRKHFPKTEFCQCCKSVPPYDLANISNEYKRDITDWEWLCRKCHMNKDGRIGNLKIGSIKRKDLPKEQQNFIHT
jgi:endogenous inhibitor of DNA gyrase (YacG/DUF329 family)